MTSFARARRMSLALGVAGLLLAMSAFGHRDALAQAWLIATLLCVGMAVGCLAIALLHQLTGGEWGVVIERALEAGARTLPWLALAFVPILLWLPTLYEWARPGATADPKLAHKAAYLNVWFFVVRTAFYLAVWTVLARLLDRWSTERDTAGDPRSTVRLRGLAAVGLIVLGLTVSFAAIDWVMSLEPRWYSTVFGGLVGVGWMLDAFSLVIALTAAAGPRSPLSPLLSEKVRIDLGNLLLTFVVLWTYLAFVQLLIIWSGNIPEEVVWYAHRLGGGWARVAWLLVLGRFLLPLLVLVFRAAKRSRVVTAGLAVLLIFTAWANTLWLVAPAFRPDRLALHWLDVVVSLGLGGLWLALFFTLLSRRPLVAVGDPALVMREARHAA